MYSITLSALRKVEEEVAALTELLNRQNSGAVMIIPNDSLSHTFYMHSHEPSILVHTDQETPDLSKILADIPAQKIVIIGGQLPLHDLAALCLERSCMVLDDLSSIIQVANDAIWHYSSHIPLNKKNQKTRFKQIPRSARKSGCRGK